MIAALNRVFTPLNRFLSNRMYVVVFSGIAAGLVFPGLVSLKAYVPYIFGYMTLVMALGISVRDMGRVVRSPGPLFLILAGLHVVLPLVSYLLSGMVLGFSSPYTVGVVLSLVIPVGVASVIWNGIAGGEVPLALTTVAVDSFLSPFVVPLTVSLLFGTTVVFDSIGMMRGLLLMIVLPTGIGILVHELSGGKAGRNSINMNGALSKLALSLVVAVNVAGARSVMIEPSFTLVPVVALLFLQAMGGYALGYAAGKLIPSRPSRRVTYVYSIGMRNISAGIVIALQYFAPETVVPVVLAMVFQQPLAAVTLKLLRRKNEAAMEPEQS